MKNIAILGMPGSGKGTISNRLVKEYGFIHLAMGDLIRNEQKNETKIGKFADRLIDQGRFLPDNVVIEMFQGFIKSNPTDVGYIFDGFPRTKEQAKHFHAFLLKSRLNLDKVLYLDIHESMALKRLLKRAETEGRKDDKEEVIKRRIGIYNEKTKPIVNFFSDKGLVAKIDSNVGMEEQYQSAIKALELE